MCTSLYRVINVYPTAVRLVGDKQRLPLRGSFKQVAAFKTQELAQFDLQFDASNDLAKIVP